VCGDVAVAEPFRDQPEDQFVAETGGDVDPAAQLPEFSAGTVELLDQKTRSRRHADTVRLLGSFGRQFPRNGADELSRAMLSK
jgi:hypothetical protein